MLKEMRVKQEKRASVIPLPRYMIVNDDAPILIKMWMVTRVTFTDCRESGESKAEGKDDENPFGGIKLR